MELYTDLRVQGSGRNVDTSMVFRVARSVICCHTNTYARNSIVPLPMIGEYNEKW